MSYAVVPHPTKRLAPSTKSTSLESIRPRTWSTYVTVCEPCWGLKRRHTLWHVCFGGVDGEWGCGRGSFFLYTDCQHIMMDEFVTGSCNWACFSRSVTPKSDSINLLLAPAFLMNLSGKQTASELQPCAVFFLSVLFLLPLTEDVLFDLRP